jgi:anti-anti-sigma factor
MQAHFEDQSSAAIVRLSGRLTFAENNAFRNVVEGMEKDGRGSVVLDLAELEFIDSAGMGLLLVARDLTHARGGSVTLANAHGQVARMLRLAKFGDFFTLDFDCAQV